MRYGCAVKPAHGFYRRGPDQTADDLHIVGCAVISTGRAAGSVSATHGHTFLDSLSNNRGCRIARAARTQRLRLGIAPQERVCGSGGNDCGRVVDASAGGAHTDVTNTEEVHNGEGCFVEGVLHVTPLCTGPTACVTDREEDTELMHTTQKCGQRHVRHLRVVRSSLPMLGVSS